MHLYSIISGGAAAQEARDGDGNANHGGIDKNRRTFADVECYSCIKSSVKILERMIRSRWLLSMSIISLHRRLLSGRRG